MSAALLLAAVLFVAPGVAAQVVEVGDLDGDPARYDGREVTVEGELIGDYSRRPDGWAWVQLNDDAYARRPLTGGGDLAGGNVGMGLHMPAHLLEGIDPPGRYRWRGPVVRATGTFHHHDPALGGETYLEVERLETIEPGRLVERPARAWPAVAGTALLVLSGLVHRRRRRAE